jgi:glycine C-acetyltransferase
MASIEIMEAGDEQVKKLWENGDYLKAGLKAAGFDTGKSQTPITPVIIGEAQAAKDFSAALFENGVFATAIVFPTVPKGTARVRAMVSAAHTKADLERGIAAFVKVGKEMGVIK